MTHVAGSYIFYRFQPYTILNQEKASNLRSHYCFILENLSSCHPSKSLDENTITHLNHAEKVLKDLNLLISDLSQKLLQPATSLERALCLEIPTPYLLKANVQPKEIPSPDLLDTKAKTTSIASLSLDLPLFMNIGYFRNKEVPFKPVNRSSFSISELKIQHSKIISLIASGRLKNAFECVLSPVRAIKPHIQAPHLSPIYWPASTKKLCSWFLHHIPQGLGKKLGQGTYSQVTTFQISPKETLAKKTITIREKPEGNEILALEEASNYMRIPPHENMTRLLGIKGCDLFVEYIPGKTLWAILYTQELTTEQIRSIFLDIAKALEHLHSNGWTFKDLKPDNILLTHDYRAKLCDFGFVKRSETDRALIGSGRYAAPEIHAFTGPASIKLDVWAFGICLLEVLIGNSFALEDVITPIRKNGVNYLCKIDPTLEICTKEALVKSMPIPNQSRVAKLDPNDLFISLVTCCLDARHEKRPSMTDIIQKLNSGIEEKMKHLVI